jgi:hypothetical protein
MITEITGDCCENRMKRIYIYIYIVTDLHYAGHPLPRSYVTGDTAVTTQR